MMSPDGTVTELNQLRAGQLITVFAGFKMFLFQAAGVNITVYVMLGGGTCSARAFTAVASLILNVINAGATVQTARCSQALAIDGTRLFSHDLNIITAADI
jgi:hypothetical protein